MVVLEIGVAIIQGYVFRLLITLYLNEAKSIKFLSLSDVYNILDFLSKKSRAFKVIKTLNIYFENKDQDYFLVLII